MNKSSHTPTRPRPQLLLALLAAVAAGVLAAGCGGSSGTYEGSPPPDYAAKLAGSPPPLAALHNQENQLLDGGVEGFEERMAELEGFPVVVNFWASWCGPCREEFPLFQDAAANLGREVAFLGVDSEDGDDLAADFLELNPVPYPSFIDRKRDIANELGVPRGLPATLYFDSDGEKTFLRQGEYKSIDDLESDIRTWAIEGGES